MAALGNPVFQLVAGLSGIIGFAISFSSLWFLSQVCSGVSGLQWFSCLRYAVVSQVCSGVSGMHWCLRFAVIFLSQICGGFPVSGLQWCLRFAVVFLSQVCSGFP